MAKASLSTHVLDTTTGKPAAGLRVHLETPQSDIVWTQKTDADGRIKELGPKGLAPGAYRLVFETRAYSPDVFFVRVTLDLQLPEGHTHVPLLLSRFGVTSYRGT